MGCVERKIHKWKMVSSPCRAHGPRHCQDSKHESREQRRARAAAAPSETRQSDSKFRVFLLVRMSGRLSGVCAKARVRGPRPKAAARGKVANENGELHHAVARPC